MRSKHHRSRTYAACAALTLAAGALGLSTAGSAAAAPVPVAPHQAFVGQVNGQTQGAVITVGCFGPVFPGETGHPVSGQSVSASLAVSSPTPIVGGYTGEAAHSIRVGFGVSTVSTVVSLSAYDVKVPIPTALNLPCYGTGQVAFVPEPTSATARTAFVSVTYVSIGVTPAP